ncbi:MAG: DUF7126 family protein [Halodesulfurarchaeum sp.]
MTHALIIGPDRGLEAALADAGVETTRIDGPTTEAKLDGAGLADAALLFVTDAAEGSAIPVARDLHPTVRIVWYAPEAVPGFVSRPLDLGVDPSLIEPDALVAEQLVAVEDR